MDEPTTALDVTVEAAVLDLLDELKKDFQTANIFITHNLDYAFEVADRIVVLCSGRIVGRLKIEEASKSEVVSLMMGVENAG